MKMYQKVVPDENAAFADSVFKILNAYSITSDHCCMVAYINGKEMRFNRHCCEGWAQVNQHNDYHQGGDQGGEINVDWTERKESVLYEIRRNPDISTIQIAKALHLSMRQVEKTLKMLKDENKLHHEGSARFGHWVINE